MKPYETGLEVPKTPKCVEAVITDKNSKTEAIGQWLSIYDGASIFKRQTSYFEKAVKVGRIGDPLFC